MQQELQQQAQEAANDVAYGEIEPQRVDHIFSPGAIQWAIDAGKFLARSGGMNSWV